MSEHLARIRWQRDGAVFTDQRYSRAHRWEFDGGAQVPAAASPDVVAPALTDVSAVDPEEAFVAAVASCHMLWFLSLAAAAGVCVDSYDDQAVGTLGKVDGRLAIREIVLRPRLTFAGEAPTAERIAALHEAAHERCFIANSVRCPIRVQSGD
ncbi:MAG TPA: OsmC family protein [Tahibacter sp.]|uniref:OsmC family protein n=1 Tax=Tahibacter sp. TaxID=2056211 RepID=UPI002BFC92C7|nr:OsmC family protein [Tahibacter sp.]HSX59492.1 OsmC family protein [Tahibacter sp.]